MSVVVTVSNRANLKKAQNLLGAKSESETIDLALEKIIEDFESQPAISSKKNLSDDFFEDLLSEKNNLFDGESIRAVVEEREESKF